MQPQPPTPPRLATQLLVWFLRKDLAEEVLGDLHEEHFILCQEGSTAKANRRYWYQVIHYLRPFAIKPANWPFVYQLLHIKDHFRLFWISLTTNKIQSIIQVSGLLFSLVLSLLISLYVFHESGFDSHYQKKNIYRLVNSQTIQGEPSRWSAMQAPIKGLIQEKIEKEVSIARTLDFNFVNAQENYIQLENSSFHYHEEGFLYADPELLNLVEIPMIYGKAGKALASRGSMVISRKILAKYFDYRNPLGQKVIMNGDSTNVYTIDGVMEDLPTQSHLQADFLLSLKDWELYAGEQSDWCCRKYNCYLKLSPEQTKRKVEKQLSALKEQKVNHLLLAEDSLSHHSFVNDGEFTLQPIEDIYINRLEVYDNSDRHASIIVLRLLTATTLLLLFIGGSSFVHLAITRPYGRLSSQQYEKIIGRQKAGIAFYPLYEAIFFCVLAMIMAAILAQVLLPLFNMITHEELVFPWSTWWCIPLMLVIAIFIGVLSGAYPAFHYAAYHSFIPSREMLQRNVKVRFLLVGFRLTITLIVWSLTFTSFDLYHSFMTRSLGYDRHPVMSVLGLDMITPSQKVILKKDLLKLPDVEAASLSDFIPVANSLTNNLYYWPIERRNEIEGQLATRWVADEAHLDVLSIDLVAGRYFQSDSTDRKSLVINESMGAALSLTQPVGNYLVDMFDQEYEIIGVIKDFHYQSLVRELQPLVFVYGASNYTLNIKAAASIGETLLTDIQRVWEKHVPQVDFRYQLLNKGYEDMYELFNIIRWLLLAFSLVLGGILWRGLHTLHLSQTTAGNRRAHIQKHAFMLLLVGAILAVSLGWPLLMFLLASMAYPIQVSWYHFTIGPSVLLLLIVFLPTVGSHNIQRLTTDDNIPT